ncbi:DUF4352 domain-containing protein [Streptomyces sp. JB150]|uniref:DUF4352 domain-containing protein n=1 Tax=Streptomyces sp. JB150 TaxID=2714844 RepID=UPI00140A878A|nr:DUF4352 domain-containing protein [Streptomyces sp. JB150]QIJ62562.1 DUF4352 domain-containing protein [Streptomyces sp. JB150]
MRTTAALGAMIIAVAALAACADDKPKPATATVTETVTAAPTRDRPASPPDTEPGDSALAFTDTATYENNIEVSLSSIRRAVSSDTASPSNTPYARFNIKVTNGSSENVNLSLMSVQCQYGQEGREGDEIFDSARGLEGAPSTHLRPGRSLTATFGCELPRNETYLQVEVRPNFGERTAIFAGNVQ